MCIEIEAKLKIESPQQTEARLVEIGAEFKAEQSQIDHHFDNDAFSISSSDSALRLRLQHVGDELTCFLTYKGPKQKSRLKRRPEMETEIKDPDAVEKILLALGYKKKLTVEKTRRLWLLDRCEVAVDNLPMLGDFVEIEGPTEDEIKKVQERLGLSDSPHIPKGYASMVARKLGKLGRRQQHDESAT
ncbi:MAG: class IV adenylate cyclase [Sedimentisphaerales bacterium]|nr:class IV adenylate cyclase [Sedimentisphaerales bacterium]